MGGASESRTKGAEPAVSWAPLRQLFAQVGQIYFEPSPWAGLVIVAAMAWAHPWGAAGMLWASVVVLALTRLSERAGRRWFEPASASAGLVGYNATLTGAGLLSLFAPSPRVFAYLTVVSVVSALVSARWLRWGRLALLTSLFVLAMWGALALGAELAPALTPEGCPGPLTASVPCSIGQVTFIAGALPGSLVALALILCAPLPGLWLGAGALVGALLAVLGSFGAGAEGIGLAVNAGLTAMALAVHRRGPGASVAGLGLAALLCLVFAAVELPYFTLPFILATWVLLSATKERGAP